MNKKKLRLVITGGHLTPALAVIEELQRQGDWEILFIGRKYAAEGDRTPSIGSQVIRNRGIRFAPIRAGRLQRRFTRWTIPAALKIPLGFFQAFFHLVRFRPQVILSFGGYVSVPVVLAGWFLKIPAITHEQTNVKGLATKINTPFAKKIAVSWPETLGLFPSSKVILTGNPIRKAILDKPNRKIWQTLDYPSDLPLVFITGGNQGSHVINKAVEESLLKLVKMANVFHQCGYLQAMGDFERLEKARSNLPFVLQKRYHVKKYLDTQEMATLLQKADLVVSRAGANTLTELAVLGKPALLIPFPWLYHDEQIKNAEILERVGTAEIIPQGDFLAQRLLVEIRSMLRSLGDYQKNAPQAKKLVKLDAVQKIVELVEKTVDEKKKRPSS